VREHVHPQTGQPIGAPVDDTPAPRPGPVTLEGHYGRVEKLTRQHASSLWDAVRGNNAIWTYMSQYGPFADAAEFSAWVESRAALDDPYAYAIVDRANRAVGIATLMEIRPAMRVVEVGHIVYSPALQRTPLGPRRNTCLPAMRSRRSATGATSGNVIRTMPPRAGQRCVTVLCSRASCVSR
jgi:hypothetical protein